MHDVYKVIYTSQKTRLYYKDQPRNAVEESNCSLWYGYKELISTICAEIRFLSARAGGTVYVETAVL